jgi:hypothetical protein
MQLINEEDTMGTNVEIEVTAGTSGFKIPLSEANDEKVKEVISKISRAGMFNYDEESDVTTIVPPTAISVIRVTGLGEALGADVFSSNKVDSRIVAPGL